MNRRTFITGIAATAIATQLPAHATAQEATEVIDPKLTALFGEDWASIKVTLGDYIDAFDAVFGAYIDPEWFGDRAYRIPDVASITLDVEDTGQVSGITLFPFNSGENRDTTPDQNDDRRWTYAQADTVMANLLPDDATTNADCVNTYGTEDSGFTTYLEMMGTSEELYAKVLPETYAAADSDAPTQGAFGARVTIEADDDGAPTERVENVGIFLESWALTC